MVDLKKFRCDQIQAMLLFSAHDSEEQAPSDQTMKCLESVSSWEPGKIDHAILDELADLDSDLAESLANAHIGVTTGTPEDSEELEPQEDGADWMNLILR